MPTHALIPLLADLQARLPEVMLRDQHRLRRRIDGIRRVRNPKARQAIVEQIGAELDAAAERLARRRAAMPTVSYPAELPVSQKKDDIAAAIRDHQVVIIAGETGSGKTTQIPKICLELGRGTHGLIGHTQPRRLAARTVAERIAEELDTPLGEAVGYKVRFTDQAGEDTYVKLMTDGILLAEIQQDRQLRQYDTLIIDEAHERSLNIDFILGYLKQLLPRRPDLKVIITSATIDPERFARHFGVDSDTPAPIIEVSGRTYPVEVRYRPVVDPDDADADPDRDQMQAISDAVEELYTEGDGDILVFLSGEREIRDTADALNRLALPHTEVLPLYARLSAAEQHRVFQRHTGRRVVLATNVAETSLTVPGIKYVVDPGTARISRYSHRTKVQRLPIEPISQASANQRKGRCGRTSDGVCIRLYSEEAFVGRPEFTEPEILRTNLASVILQMTSLKLGDIAAFPFIDPPDRRSIKDGVDLLHELGAFDLTQGRKKATTDAADEPAAAATAGTDETTDPSRVLTPLGRKLAQLPIDPRLARMVLEADRNGCAREVMVIAAALSIQDPRERPVDKQQAAAQAHSRFAEPESDFLVYLNLWNYLREQQKALSSNQFRRLCRTEFLNYLRIREWQDIESQLRRIAKTIGISPNEQNADPRNIHVALLSGLLSHIGLKDVEKGEKGEYLGARNAKFAVFPGSTLFKKPPRWVMAAELVETSRLWGRVAARIDPDWIEPLAEHLVKRSYSEPHWEKNRGAVMAAEKVTLYGVPIVVARPVNYWRIDPELARELFIRHALVEGDWRTHHKFFHENRRLLEEVEELEHRARRRDILVDDEALFEFYDQRIGADVVSGRHFDSWWKKARRDDPELLNFEKSMLINEAAGQVSEQDYPNHWQQGQFRLPLTYQFEPGADADGVTVHIPLSVLNQVTADGFDWQVPGLREDLVTALIKSLPKQVRRSFVPVPDHARAVLARISPADGPLLEVLEDELHRMSGTPIPHRSWQPERVPDHLKITFRVVDEQQHSLGEGKDLQALKNRLQGTMQTAIASVADGLERHGLTGWSLDELPKVFEQQQGVHAVRGYPALLDEGRSVGVRMFGTPAEQRHAMWRGTRRLLMLNVPSPVRYLHGRLTNHTKLLLTNSPHGSVAALIDDCTACAVDKLVAEAGGPAWDAAGFDALLAAVRAGLNSTALDIIATVSTILATHREVEQRLGAIRGATTAGAVADIRAQVDRLVHPGFVTDIGWPRLTELPRYLQAVQRRLEKLLADPYRDQQHMLRIQQVWAYYEEVRDELVDGHEVGNPLEPVRWMIEELRVSLYAQTLGTAHPVSEKRIYRAIHDLAP